MAKHEPDVVLMDIRMPGMDGLAATELLRAHDDPPEVIVLTTFEVGDDVLRALRAGASGFLLKDTPPADIVRAVRAVAAGEPMLSPTVTRRLIGHVTDGRFGDRQRRAREQLDRLTEREREVAVALGLGKSNAEISRELYMSVATVKAHVSRRAREARVQQPRPDRAARPRRRRGLTYCGAGLALGRRRLLHAGRFGHGRRLLGGRCVERGGGARAAASSRSSRRAVTAG